MVNSMIWAAKRLDNKFKAAGKIQLTNENPKNSSTVVSLGLVLCGGNAVEYRMTRS